MFMMNFELGQGHLLNINIGKSKFIRIRSYVYQFYMTNQVNALCLYL